MMAAQLAGRPARRRAAAATATTTTTTESCLCATAPTSAPASSAPVSASAARVGPEAAAKSDWPPGVSALAVARGRRRRRRCSGCRKRRLRLLGGCERAPLDYGCASQRNNDNNSGHTGRPDCWQILATERRLQWQQLDPEGGQTERPTRRPDSHELAAMGPLRARPAAAPADGQSQGLQMERADPIVGCLRSNWLAGRPAGRLARSLASDFHLYIIASGR